MSFTNNKKAFAKELDKKLNESLSFVEIYSRYKHAVEDDCQTSCVIGNCKSSDAFTFYDNCCKCYSCNQKVTNVVNLYMHINNTSNYYESLYNLARDFGVIENEFYQLNISDTITVFNSIKWIITNSEQNKYLLYYAKQGEKSSNIYMIDKILNFIEEKYIKYDNLYIDEDITAIYKCI